MATRSRRPSRWTGYAPLDASPRAQFEAAVADMREGLRRWRNWSYLAVENVKNRYRRTVLGPWWLTLQMGIFVVGISIIFGSLQARGSGSSCPTSRSDTSSSFSSSA